MKRRSVPLYSPFGTNDRYVGKYDPKSRVMIIDPYHLSSIPTKLCETENLCSICRDSKKVFSEDGAYLQKHNRILVLKKDIDCGFDQRYIVVENISNQRIVKFLREHFTRVPYISLYDQPDFILRYNINTREFWDLAKTIALALEIPYL